MNKRPIFSCVLVLFFAQAIILLSSVDIYAFNESVPGGQGAASGAKLPPGIAKQLENKGEADFLLVLEDSDARALAKTMRERLHLRNDNAAIMAEKARLFKEKKNKVLSGISAQDYTVLKDYDNFPIVYLRANSHALDNFLKMTEVASIAENRIVHPFDVYTDNQTLIGIPAAWAYGTGADTSVAVLDTGVDPCTVPEDPGCSVVFEQCFGTQGTGGTPHCYADNSHGTNVQGIVLQVAPDADLLSLDVFSIDGYAYYSDILDALDWLLTPQDPDPAPYVTYNTVAVNMSFGGLEGYTSPCSADGLAFGISTMKDDGITTTVASGNYGYTDALTAPACAPGAVSVGAVYTADYTAQVPITWSACTDTTATTDQVTCFSDSAEFLTMLAPGAIITAGGYTKSGTSQAAPHVAGAVAVLKSQTPALTVDEVVARLTATGTPVTDTRDSLTRTKPRLDLAAAVSVTKPIIVINPSSVSFIAAAGGALPIARTLNVTNGGADVLNWSIDSYPSWLTPGTLNGVGSGSSSLQINTTALSPDSYTGSLSISATDSLSNPALNSPVSVPVTYYVVDSAYAEDFEAGDFTKFPWLTGGDASWTVQDATVHTGSNAAQSGAITDYQSTYLEIILDVLSPGYVYFWIKTSTEQDWDQVKFYVDGVNEGPWNGWSGETPWTFVSSEHAVSTGIHTFQWVYSKDIDTSSGSDAVWLDDVFFPQSSAVLEARIYGTPSSYFSTLQAAYNAASDGDVIQAQAVDFGETLDLNRPLSATIKGGYNETFSDNPADSAIVGSLTISDGTVTVENITIK
jgi:hypothetical protein